MKDMEKHEKQLDAVLIEILSAIKDISINVALNTQAIKTLNKNVESTIDAKIIKLELKYAAGIIAILCCSGLLLTKIVIPKMADELIPQITEQIIKKGFGR